MEMPGTAPDDRLYVVVGLLADADGRLFIQKRRPGTPKAGMWEFPGGKLEQNEDPGDGLARELVEELGIKITALEPLTVVTHDYDHARVWLDTYLVTGYEGEVTGREGQEIAWVRPGNFSQYDVLPAVIPILKAFLSHSA